MSPDIAQIPSDGDQVAFSSITLAEIVYLSEKGRISLLRLERLLAAVDATDAVLAEVAFNRTEVPDISDRIIAATALYLGVPLISRDRKIQLSSVNTIW